MPFKAILFLTVFCGGCIASLRYPMVGIINYMSMYMFALNQTWWFNATNPLGIRYSFVAGIFLLVGLFLSGEAHRFHICRLANIERWLLLFLAIIWLSLILGVGINQESWLLVDKMTKVFVFLFVMTHLVITPKRYATIRWLWVISTLYVGYLCFTASAGMFIGGRLSGIGGGDFMGSSGLSLHLSRALPFIGISFLISHKWWAKGLAIVSASFVVNALILMQTRSSFIAIIFGGIIALLRAPKHINKKFFIYMLIGVVGFYSLTDSNFWKRMNTIEVEESKRDTSSQGRIEIWKTSLSMLQNKPAGVGIGRFIDSIGNYSDVIADLDAHSTYVRCYSELGIHGFFIFLLILFKIFHSLNDMRKHFSKYPQQKNQLMEVFSLEIALVINMVGSAFTTTLYNEGFWWLIGMVICLEKNSKEKL